MNEFLEVIETIRAEEASLHRLFGGEGDGVRQGGRRRARDPEYRRKLGEAVKLIADVVTGRRPAYHLQEVMTTSDFPNLFGDVIDRMLLAAYREAPATWRNFVKVETVRDFRTVKRFTISGAESTLEQVAEQGPYPEASLTDGVYSYAVQKYGRRIPFSWETLINDDLGAFNDIVQRLGRAARRTEQKFATQLYVDANGPHASLYTDANNNRIHSSEGASNNPVLSIAAFQEAFTVLSKQRDEDGEPIFIETVELVVPPALEVVALNILNATQLELETAGGTTTEKLITANWMRNRVRLNVDPYIPVIATTNGNTSWFLFANPSAGRPALVIGHLRGHEEPEVFVKSPNAIRVGGGEDPLNGDFDHDGIHYKVRHVLGGTRMDPKATVASKGTGQA